MNTENICRMCKEEDCPVKEQIRRETKPVKKSMMDINKDILLNYLKERHTGEENAVFSRELEYMMDMSGRDIRRVISALRKDGVPICSDYHKGYYYAEKQSEVERTLKGLGEYIDGMNETIAMLAKAKAQMIPKIRSIRIIITPDEGPEQELQVLVS